MPWRIAQADLRFVEKRKEVACSTWLCVLSLFCSASARPSSRSERLVAVLLSVSLAIVTIGASDRSAYAASANLVWKPYLQQLTDTSVIVRWTTRLQDLDVTPDKISCRR